MTLMKQEFNDGDANEAVDAAYRHLWAVDNGIDLDTLAYGTEDDSPPIEDIVPDWEPGPNETRDFRAEDAPVLAGRLTTPYPDLEIPTDTIPANYLG